MQKKLRNLLTSVSTGSLLPGGGRREYYSTKGGAINRADFILQDFGLKLDRDDLYDFYGDEGRKQVNVCDEYGHVKGWVMFVWYRMPSGNYEFTVYGE